MWPHEFSRPIELMITCCVTVVNCARLMIRNNNRLGAGECFVHGKIVFIYLFCVDRDKQQTLLI